MNKVTIQIPEKNMQLDRSLVQNKSPYDRMCGFTGIVTDVNAENCTVTVLSEFGREFIGVRVASKQWITKYDDFLSGERDLPPVNSYVYCLMTDFQLQNAIVLFSVFGSGKSVHTEFKEKNKEAVRKRVLNSGWIIEEDFKNNTIKIQNAKNPTFNAEIDKDGNITVITKGNVTIEAEKGTAITVKENIEIKTEKNVVITAKQVKVNEDFIITDSKCSIFNSFEVSK